MSGTFFHLGGAVECLYGQSWASGCRRHGLPRPEPGELSFPLVQKPRSLSRIPEYPGRKLEVRAPAHSGLRKRPQILLRSEDDAICRPGSTKSGNPLPQKECQCPASKSDLSNLLKKRQNGKALGGDGVATWRPTCPASRTSISWKFPGGSLKSQRRGE